MPKARSKFTPKLTKKDIRGFKKEIKSWRNPNYKKKGR